MRFEVNMRGQNVAINYGTNPMGEVAGVWVELADGGQADSLTATDELTAWSLANQHHAQGQLAIDADQVDMPLVIEFVRFVQRSVNHLQEPERSARLMAVAAAIRDESPNMTERVANVLFPQGVAA